RQLEAVRVEFLGARQGRIKDLQALVGKASKEEKPAVGKKFNDVKTRVTTAHEERKRSLARPSVAAGALDVTLPGVVPALGRRHPLAQTTLELKDIMGGLGFPVADAREIEDEYHNFEALNFPPDHPARDPLDNFYLAPAGLAWGGGPRL